MPEKLDDLDALRAIVTALADFERADQERILRWTREKLGLSPSATELKVPQVPPAPSQAHDSHSAQVYGSSGSAITKDIKSFISEKKPSSDNQFAAAVAYYYRFEAPADERKNAITGGDLQEAARLAGRSRLNRPTDTLNNALKGGLLDKGSERGTYVLNTVGENLVAMTLPSSGADTPNRSRARKSAKASKKASRKGRK